jgi:hypothetical protein
VDFKQTKDCPQCEILEKFPPPRNPPRPTERFLWPLRR